MDVYEMIRQLNNKKPTFIGKEDYRESAVLIPLIKKSNKVDVLFEVRSKEISQPGDVCFPGGKIDSGETAEQSAIRETMEELGLPREAIINVTPFDYIISDIGTCIYPFVAIIDDTYEFDINQSEVAEVFSVPIQYFTENEPAAYDITFKPEPSDNFPYHLISGGENYNWRMRAKKEYFYQYKDKVIWGLTARIVKHFAHKIKQLEKEEKEIQK